VPTKRRPHVAGATAGDTGGNFIDGGPRSTYSRAGFISSRPIRTVIRPYGQRFMRWKARLEVSGTAVKPALKLSGIVWNIRVWFDV
jgi:hypothetical protein